MFGRKKRQTVIPCDTTGKVPVIRSSAAEYLTFVASNGDSAESFEMRYLVWLLDDKI